MRLILVIFIFLGTNIAFAENNQLALENLKKCLYSSTEAASTEGHYLSCYNKYKIKPKNIDCLKAIKDYTPNLGTGNKVIVYKTDKPVIDPNEVIIVADKKIEWKDKELSEKKYGKLSEAQMFERVMNYMMQYSVLAWEDARNLCLSFTPTKSKEAQKSGDYHKSSQSEAAKQ